MKNFGMLLLAIMLLSLSACGSKQSESKEVVAVEEEVFEVRDGWSSSAVTGVVTAIEKESRKVALMGSEGNLVTVTASAAIERFDEIAVGDLITFEYVTYLMAEFRDPTVEEMATPLVIVEDAEKAPEGFAPAGAIGTVVKAVVSIEALNRPFMLATVMGPGGNYLTIPMQDAKFIEELHIGQVLILTYAEATAVSLTKL